MLSMFMIFTFIIYTYGHHIHNDYPGGCKFEGQYCVLSYIIFQCHHGSCLIQLRVHLHPYYYIVSCISSISHTHLNGRKFEGQCWKYITIFIYKHTSPFVLLPVRTLLHRVRQHVSHQIIISWLCSSKCHDMDTYLRVQSPTQVLTQRPCYVLLIISVTRMQW